MIGSERAAKPFQTKENAVEVAIELKGFSVGRFENREKKRNRETLSKG